MTSMRWLARWVMCSLIWLYGWDKFIAKLCRCVLDKGAFWKRDLAKTTRNGAGWTTHERYEAVNEFYSTSISKLTADWYRIDSLHTSLQTLANSVQPEIQRKLTIILGRRCIDVAKNVKSITTQYRHTNKRPPTEPSHYVSNILRPYTIVRDQNKSFIASSREHELITLVAEAVTSRSVALKDLDLLKSCWLTCLSLSGIAKISLICFRRCKRWKSLWKSSRRIAKVGLWVLHCWLARLPLIPRWAMKTRSGYKCT